MKLTKYITETYDMGKGWMVDIVEHRGKFGKQYDAWIYEKNNGIKSYMFGVPAKQTPKEEFIDMVANLYDEYIDGYNEDNDALEDYYNNLFMERSDAV